MKTKTFFAFCLVWLFTSLCFGQTPEENRSLTTADREAWRRVLQWPDELEGQWKRSRFDHNSDHGGLVFYKLNRNNYLAMITVHESSYQPRYIFMYYSPSSERPIPARLLKLKMYERDDDDGHVSGRLVTEVEGLATFDDAKKQLLVHTKGRGTGDCGSLVRYKITPIRAVAVEARVHACYDDYSLGIVDPLRWRRVKRL